MWKSIFLFEVKYHLRQPLFYGVTLFFFVMVFGAVTTDGVTIGGSIGNVNRNAPYVILQLLGVMSMIGLFVVTAFVASSAQRDFEKGTHELFFSKPISKFDYLIGRFSGAMVVSFLTYVGCALGIVVGSFMPWLEPERVGPFMLGPYLFALLVIVLPNLIFMGTVFFSLASWTRSMLVTYLGVVGFFVFYAIAGVLLGDIENETLGNLLDPFGIGSLLLATKYWTIVERNTSLPEIGGVLLWNRLLWTGVGLAVLGFCYATFNPARSRKARKKKRRKGDEEAAVTARPAAAGPAMARPAAARPVIAPRSFSAATVWRQYLRQTRFEIISVFKSVPFIVILAFGVFNVIGGASFVNQFYGVKVYPVTHLMLRAIQGSYLFLLVIIITFYAGEMIWRERSLKQSDVYDAMPTPNGVYLGAKLTGLLLITMAFVSVGMLATIGVQIYRGYYNFELGVYAQGFVVNIVPFLLICFLACFLQIVANSKFVGYMLMIVYLVSATVLGALDFQHNLYQFAGTPSATYSDMNGYGHFLVPWFWFSLYWALACVVLVALTVLFWARGTETAWKTRWKIAKGRFRGPVRPLLAAGLAGFVATGVWIFYNTNVLNDYIPTDKGEEQQADYEKKYRQYKDIALPRITAVQADVDIFPYQRRVEIRGKYTMVNETDAPIRDLHFNLNPQVQVNQLDLPAHQRQVEDEELGYNIYELSQPLAPGDSMEFAFDLTVENRGFRNHGSNTQIVYNGTFFNNRAYFPVFGFSEGRQLVDRNTRRKYDLEPVHRFAKIDDDFARRNTYLGVDADWIDFETTVSTSADQIAIAPGYLQKEWTEGDRRYFHYKMDVPILAFFSYLSARYEVVRDEWNGVAIEIYHHAPHTYNVDRMINSIKKSLDYFSTEFSPYQHRQVRIIEFPRYASFAQSFPNTIPYSESIGFIARIDDEEDIDFPFYVTAHEVAHQWWAHQVIGGYVQGATMLSETMSQYSALMVMEKEYGPEKMRRFLKYELDRYLRSRGGELVEEMPLKLVENQQYIHYRKGSVVSYALRDYLGEETLNGALKRYVAEVAFQEPPFTTTLEFLDYVREAAPEELQSVITDLFDEITLYDNRVEEATYTERGDGTYLVKLETQAKKMRADGQGVETEIPIDDWIDVAVFGEEERDGETEEKVLFLEKRRVSDSDATFEVVVNDLPVRAGIDPYNKLVDRNSDDNVKRVSKGEEESVASTATLQTSR